VPQFARRTERPKAELAVNHDTAADSGAYSEKHHSIGRASMAERKLTQGRHARIIEEVNGAA
jgi:hypothetical protein